MFFSLRIIEHTVEEGKELFFELIRVSLGTQASLSRLPSANEWDELFNLAKKQSLVGITFIGLQNIAANYNDGFASIGIRKQTYLTWMGLASKIRAKNKIVNGQCRELQQVLQKKGIRSSVLKGQGVSCLYNGNEKGFDLSLFRQSGDIDVYVDCGRERAIAFARELQGDVDWDYKHLHLDVFKDTMVEVHYRVEVVSNLIRNNRLQSWFRDPKVQNSMFKAQGDLTCPSVEFNLFYILLHAYRHFLFEGVGLRQLMDYYFVLKSFSNSPTKGENIPHTIESFGIKRFARGVMWIMQDVFGLDKECLIMEPDEKEGRYILDEVMRGGNFGLHVEKHVNIKDASWKVADVKRRLRHSAHLFWHYPSEVLWNPVFIIWHKIWKLTKTK